MDMTTLETPTLGPERKEEIALLDNELFHQHPRSQQLAILATLGTPFPEQPDLERATLLLTDPELTEKLTRKREAGEPIQDQDKSYGGVIVEFFVERLMDDEEGAGDPHPAKAEGYYYTVGWSEDSSISWDYLHNLDELQGPILAKLLEDYLTQKEIGWEAYWSQRPADKEE